MNSSATHTPILSVDSMHTADGLVIQLEGELDVASCGDAVAFTERLLSQWHGAVIIDLAAVSFTDSTGLNFLARLNRRVSGSGARFVVRDPSPIVRRLIDVSGLDQCLPLEDTTAIRN